MAKLREVPWKKAPVGSAVANAKDRTGLAHNLDEVQRHPDRYEWLVVTGHDRGDLLVHRGGPGRAGRNVVIRDLRPADRDNIVQAVDQIRRARDSRTRQSLAVAVAELGDAAVRRL